MVDPLDGEWSFDGREGAEEPVAGCFPDVIEPMVGDMA
jgi:hypothetical protein